MNFLIFMDFLGFFLNFSKFNLIYFELNSFKLHIHLRANLADDMARPKSGTT